MKITRDNYEMYFLDYLEGNLNEELMDGFFRFLQENPDLKVELQQAGAVRLQEEDIAFEHKEKLFKDKYDEADVFNHAAIAYMEGDMDNEEKAKFKVYLSRQPEKLNELILFEKTKLQADQNCIFEWKSRLYKRRSEKFWLWAPRIAAVIVVGLMTYLTGNELNTKKQIARNQIIVSENRPEPTKADSIPALKEKTEGLVQTKEVVIHSESRKGSDYLQGNRKYKKDNPELESEVRERNPVEVPEKISGRAASFLAEAEIMFSLAPVHDRYFTEPELKNEERLLGDVVREKSGLNNFSLNKVAMAGLNLVSNISREKFNYETNSVGQITELNFDSRLLAFSIPTGNEK